jgi:Tfp pilus assembly major pilin PilA
MKRLFRIFELSKNEQRVVLIVIVILITVALLRYERRVHRSAVGSALTTQPKPSPAAVETNGDH